MFIGQLFGADSELVVQWKDFITEREMKEAVLANLAGWINDGDDKEKIKSQLQTTIQTIAGRTRK